MASYKVDYNDERFTNVTNEKNAELNANDQMYQEMIDSVDTKYNGLQADLDANRAEQEKLLQEQTDFTIDKIEQDRANAQKDYLKEQSGAYVDWQKESNKYGANAEQMAASGLTNSGFHESTQVSIYNTYQNRLATARESMVRADQDFTNQIKEAQLQNSSLLAQIASDTLQQKLQLTLEAFQYKNNLITEKANTRRNILSYYDSKWENVLAQINTENAIRRQAEEYQYDLDYKNRQLKLEEDKFKAEQEALGLLEEDEGNSQPYYVGEYGPLPKVEFDGRSKQSAVDFMRKYGVDESYASQVMSQHDFDMAKATGKNIPETRVATYMAYLKAYVDHAING